MIGFADIRHGALTERSMLTVANYIPAVRTGNHVYTSGQVPFKEGKLVVGKHDTPTVGSVYAGVEALADQLVP